MTMGIVDSGFLGGTGCCRTSRDDDVDFETNQFGRQVRQPIVFSLGPAPLNDNVFPLHVAKLAQALRGTPRCGPIERNGCQRLGTRSAGFSLAAAPGPRPHTLRMR